MLLCKLGSQVGHQVFFRSELAVVLLNLCRHHHHHHQMKPSIGDDDDDDY